MTKTTQVKLLRASGAPYGIYFKKHAQNANSYIIRVTGNGEQTDIGANPEDMPRCYEKAIDKRLELLGIPDDADAWQKLASAYGAFLTHYGIEIKQVIKHEFKFTKGQ
jgi:hypothetical protein